VLSLLGDEHETHLALVWGSGVPLSVVGGGDLREVWNGCPHQEHERQQPNGVEWEKEKVQIFHVHFSSSFLFLLSFLCFTQG
jgi:hypothetical protein